MSLEVKYTKIEDVDNKDNVLVRIDKIKSLRSFEVPDEYLYGSCKHSKSLKTYCAWIDGEDVLVVYNAEEGTYMGNTKGNQNIHGYRVGDIIESDEFDKLVEVLNVCGNRLHDIKLSRRGLGKVLDRGVIRI